MVGKLRPKSGLDLWEVQNCYGWGNCGSRPPPDSILSRRMVSQWGGWVHGERWCPQEESNLQLRFRKPLFYPLNYEGLRG